MQTEKLSSITGEVEAVDIDVDPFNARLLKALEKIEFNTRK